MSQLQTLLQTKASTIEPSPGAFPRVLREVHRRKHRRVIAVVTSVAVVAAVSDNQLVLTPTKIALDVKPVVVPNATGTTGSVSWDRGGNGLFASVGGRWVRVSDPTSATGPRVQDLNVPAIPGGPILLS